jgi:hypothetical protein
MSVCLILSSWAYRIVEVNPLHRKQSRFGLFGFAFVIHSEEPLIPALISIHIG